MKCPNCNSNNITRERRPNGNDKCLDCQHAWPSSDSEVGGWKNKEFEKLVSNYYTALKKVEFEMRALSETAFAIKKIFIALDKEEEYRLAPGMSYHGNQLYYKVSTNEPR